MLASRIIFILFFILAPMFFQFFYLRLYITKELLYIYLLKTTVIVSQFTSNQSSTLISDFLAVFASVVVLDWKIVMVTEVVTVVLIYTCFLLERQFILLPLWWCCTMWMSNCKDITLDILMTSSGKRHNSILL